MQRTKYAAEFKSATPYHYKQSSHFVQRYRVTFFCVLLLANTHPIDRVRRLFEGFLSFKRAFNLIGMLQII